MTVVILSYIYYYTWNLADPNRIETITCEGSYCKCDDWNDNCKQLNE